MKKISAILLIVVALSSCRKTMDEVTPDVPAPASMSELQVSPEFNWQTTRDVTLVVKGFVNGLIEVTSAEKGVYHRAFLMQGQSHTLQFSVPAYEDAVLLNYMGQKVEMKLTGSKLTHEFKLQ